MFYFFVPYELAVYTRVYELKSRYRRSQKYFSKYFINEENIFAF